jgi:hypothetical protein
MFWLLFDNINVFRPVENWDVIIASDVCLVLIMAFSSKHPFACRTYARGDTMRPREDPIKNRS